MARSAMGYLATFLLAVLAATLALVGAAMIPRAAIQQNMLESGEYMLGREQVEYLVPGVRATQLHYSADATWLSIAYDL